MTTETALTCCACGRQMRPQLSSWTFRCTDCRCWASSLDITINAHEGRQIDENLRESGLEAIRAENDRRVLDALDSLTPLSETTLLDVGSAYGWFLSAAASRGATVFGIEPDEQVAERSQLPETVRRGFFPAVLRDGEHFDVITYNDVLEHFPDPAAAIHASVRHLNPGGLLSINIPDSRGLGFAISRAAARAGMASSYERLWQKDLPSPHLWYLNPGTLNTLASREGLELVHQRRLPSLSAKGLWDRIHMDRRPSLVSRSQFLAISLLRPAFNSPAFSDILHIVFRKPGRSGSPATTRADEDPVTKSEVVKGNRHTHRAYLPDQVSRAPGLAG
jgi:SAM-dependent methyltransferase